MKVIKIVDSNYIHDALESTLDMTLLDWFCKELLPLIFASLILIFLIAFVIASSFPEFSWYSFEIKAGPWANDGGSELGFYVRILPYFAESPNWIWSIVSGALNPPTKLSLSLDSNWRSSSISFS